MEDLEAAVRASWDRDAIAVYGDHLQAIGDPRGELVAIDLRIDEGHATPEVLARRVELIAQWFGDRLPPGLVRYGFVDVDATSAEPDSQLALALRGPGGRWVRSVTLAGPPELLRRALDMLVAQPRPWLTKLVVRQWNELDRPAIADDLAVALVGALPNLAELAAEGRRVFRQLGHASVRRLRMSGFDALASLADMPVASLDLAIHCHYAREHADPDDARLSALLAAERLPALRELDLSRNEPGRLEPHTLGGSVDIAKLVSTLSVRTQLEVLRLPQVRSQAHRNYLQGALATMPHLRELVLHGQVTESFTHPTATVRLVPR